MIILVIIFILLILLLFGFDEFIVNKLFNPVDKTCSVKNDCKGVGFIGDGQRSCGYKICVNKNWEKSIYKSIFKRLLALSCIQYYVTCDCVDNKCVETKYSNYLLSSEIYYKRFNSSIEFCKNIENIYNDKDKCFGNIASTQNNISICNYINDTNYKENCILNNVYNATINHCDSLTNINRKNNCLAVLYNDTSYCELYDCEYDTTTSPCHLYRQRYIYGCYIDVALKHNDIKICEKINKSYGKYVGKVNSRYDCYEEIARATNNLSLCKYSGGNKKWCYIDVNRELALLTGNASYCNHDTLCFRPLTSKFNNSDLCSNHSDTQNMELCLIYLASSNKDSLLCHNILNQTNKDKCYSNVGSKLLDPLLCNQVNEIKRKDDCYYIVGIKLLDIEICDLIIDIELKNRCKKRIKDD